MNLLLTGCLFLVYVDAQELFQNKDFEDPTAASAWGHAWGYKQDIVETSSAKQGRHILKVYNRTQSWQGPGQDVNLATNTSYNVDCWIQILNSNSKLFQEIRWTISYQWEKDSNEKVYIDVGDDRMLRTGQQWRQLRGDFTTPYRSWFKAHIFIQGPDPGIDFNVDNASLTPVSANPNWKSEANTRIEQIRKNNINFMVSLPNAFNPQDVGLEINLKNHEFAFGSVVDDVHYLDPHSKRYQDLFHEFFNWATVGSFKWKYNQGSVAHPNYTRTMNVVEKLRKNGMKIRGHNMFWGVDNSVPNEVKKMDSNSLQRTIDERIRYMTNLTRGKLDHWDVNNELLHGQFFEEKTRDPQYSEKIFSKVHSADPTPLLFLNEYDVVAVGANTLAYLNQALEFKANSHLDAIGLQSHFHDNTAPSPTLLQTRLDLLSKAGLPMWITELTLQTSDVNARADWLENALRMYFSYPSVHGIILWNFWDEGGTADSYLVNGNYLYINEVGTRYLQLIKQEWSTNVKHNLSNQNENFQVRGFLGEYEVIVRYKGKPIMLYSFTNTKGTVDVHLGVPDSTDEITLPTAMATNVPVIHTHHVTTKGKHMLGHSSSNSDSQSLECNTRYSAYSAVGDDKATSVGCNSDEVLTGCSMITIDHLHFRDGERIQMQNGQVVCVAVNAWRSSAPVQAVARCCKLQGLSCSYFVAGPSGHEQDEQVEINCASGQFALGCTSYTYFGAMDGAFSKTNSCIAQIDGDTGGVFSYAACCSAPRLSCTVNESNDSGLMRGSNSSVSCDSNWTMTGCSVYTDDGNTGGAMIKESRSGTVCYGFNGQDKFPGEMAAKSYATCCKLEHV